jgi:hypothetical protein
MSPSCFDDRDGKLIANLGQSDERHSIPFGMNMAIRTIVMVPGRLGNLARNLLCFSSKPPQIEASPSS